MVFSEKLNVFPSGDEMENFLHTSKTKQYESPAKLISVRSTLILTLMIKNEKFLHHFHYNTFNLIYKHDLYGNTR